LPGHSDFLLSFGLPLIVFKSCQGAPSFLGPAFRVRSLLFSSYWGFILSRLRLSCLRFSPLEHFSQVFFSCGQNLFPFLSDFFHGLRSFFSHVRQSEVPRHFLLSLVSSSGQILISVLDRPKVMAAPSFFQDSSSFLCLLQLREGCSPPAALLLCSGVVARVAHQ